LNQISLDASILLIEQIIDAGFNVKKIICDAVGCNEAYKKEIIDRLGISDCQEVIVESKADDTYPVVSAASICAKVTRDSIL
jgi:ribonuclease H2 subunit A